MTRFPVWLFVSLVFSAPAIPQSMPHPRPPGIADGQKQINQPLEAPMEMRSRKLNVEQVKQEAAELKKLTDSVPAQIEQVTKNQYPKDLTENLKRIEKLAKHLRTEVAP